MKKRNLKSLKLNKKSISTFQETGGRPPGSLAYSNCILCATDPLEPLPVYTSRLPWWEGGGIPSHCESAG